MGMKATSSRTSQPRQPSQAKSANHPNTELLGNGERLIYIGDAQRLCVGSPSRNQIRYWIENGMRSQVTGRLEFLEWVQVGRWRRTTVESVHRFLQRLNGNREPVPITGGRRK